MDNTPHAVVTNPLSSFCTFAIIWTWFSRLELSKNTVYILNISNIIETKNIKYKFRLNDDLFAIVLPYVFCYEHKHLRSRN